ncbi:hypothetical protein C8J56DRAFT_1060811 [Mycena floridula]|nr:hypothetical protein C8J56DRAFT_1060811 [Mycena floridula]
MGRDYYLGEPAPWSSWYSIPGVYNDSPHHPIPSRQTVFTYVFARLIFFGFHDPRNVVAPSNIQGYDLTGNLGLEPLTSSMMFKDRLSYRGLVQISSWSKAKWVTRPLTAISTTPTTKCHQVDSPPQTKHQAHSNRRLIVGKGVRSPGPTFQFVAVRNPGRIWLAAATTFRLGFTMIGCHRYLWVSTRTGIHMRGVAFRGSFALPKQTGRCRHPKSDLP